MNILYFHSNLLRDTYRCRQVRFRLWGFMRHTDIDAIFIAESDKADALELQALKTQLGEFGCLILDKTGKYRIDDELIVFEPLSLLVDDQRFIPLDGSVILIETQPEIHGNYIALDFFADEDFADYHGEIDAQSLIELKDLMNGRPKRNKSHLN